MKKVYLFTFVGILAIIVIAVNLMNFDPKVEKWSNFIAGGIVAFIIVKTPAIIAYFKDKRQKR